MVSGRRRPSRNLCCSQQMYSVILLGVLCISSCVEAAEGLRTIDASEFRSLQPRKLFSSLDELDGNLSTEDLRKLLTLLGGSKENKAVANAQGGSTLEHAASYLMPELKRTPSGTTTSAPLTTTTGEPPAGRVTTRRFYRRLRRKTTTTSTTEVSATAPAVTVVPPAPPSPPAIAQVTNPSPVVTPLPGSLEAPRLLESGPSPGDLINQLSLLNGILGALNASGSAPTTTAPPPPPPSISLDNNANINSSALVPDIIALLTGVKNIAESSSKSEVVVPPPAPPPTSPPAPPVSDPTGGLALLSLLSGAGNQNKEVAPGGNAVAASLLNLMTQSPQLPQPQPQPSESDTTAALTKLLLQSSASAPVPAVQGNSLIQPQVNNQFNGDQSNQLNNLLGLLGALGSVGQQPGAAAGNMNNNLFNLGGDQLAQAQTNSLATLFGGSQQPQAQSQNLLNLFGGNQGNQGFSLASLLAPQTGNSIPGLGLLSTVSGLGSSIFSTVSNIFGGSQDGKPRVRGKGVDTRLGVGYRLGNVGDAQLVWEIGPQLFTEPLKNELRPYTKKRESGLPAGSSASSLYNQPSTVSTAAEKEMQQIEAKRRMVQAAIQEHYRSSQFDSVYPKPSQRRSSPFGINKKSAVSKPKSPPATSTSSFFSSLPFADHLRGFWSGLTSGIMGSNNDDSSSSTSGFSFDDVRSDFSNNLMKRSSPDYTTDYESRAYSRRRMDEDANDAKHSTLTEYERLLLQNGKKNVGMAHTKSGVIEDQSQSSEEPGFFARWFKPAASTSSSPRSRPPQPTQRSSAWGLSARHDEYHQGRTPTKPSHRAHQSHRQSQPYGDPYGGGEMSFNRRNEVQGRSSGHPPRRNNARPQKRRSHNPFRNWISSFKSQAPSSAPRSRHAQQQTPGFGRRQFTKQPTSSRNSHLQHFTNTNKDLLMADANDDFVESSAVESYVPRYHQSLAYHYRQEFPDVSLADLPPSRVPSSSASAAYNSVRRPASPGQADHIVEPALLYDHLEVEDESGLPEADESFHNRNKVVVNPVLRENEKKKVLGTTTATALKHQQAITKIQRLRVVHNKTRAGAAQQHKQKIVVKSKGNPRVKPVATNNAEGGVADSTTALPSVLSTISGIFSGTTKPKLKTLLHNATSFLPSIRILPRKKNNNNNNKKEESIGKTKLTIQNGKPAVVVPMSGNVEDEEDEYDMEPAADEGEPVVQVGHDMSFADLQSLFGSSKNNNTKRRRFRIRVKESLLSTDKDKKDKSRKGDEEEEEDADGLKDIFVDIESGEVSVLKPVASLVSFAPKKEESSDEEEVDYYEDDDGDGVADADMNRKEHIFDAIQKELVSNFEKMKKAELRAEAKKRRKQELAAKGMDESIDVVTKYFDLHQTNSNPGEEKIQNKPKKPVGGLSLSL